MKLNHLPELVLPIQTRSSEGHRGRSWNAESSEVELGPTRRVGCRNAQVISRLIALKVVAGSNPSTFKPHLVEAVKEHLLHERWADAVLIWMEATDTLIDVYEEHVPIWTEDRLDSEVASMAIRTSKLFNETGPAS